MESNLTPGVGTDLLDYAPGSTATITASDFIIGSTLQFQVLHVVAAGDDGLYGTLDDVLGDNSGAGHEAWIVSDGVRTAGADGVLGTSDDGGDLDGVADGNIVTSWYINPDDSLGATFLLTATGITAGDDSVAGTADDGLSGESATTSFTDSGGSYSINFAAADPDMYIPAIPFPADVTPIVGSGDGDAEIPSAWFKSPITGTNVRVESLAPEDMALGQIVPFEIKITVDGSTAPENGVITFTAGWNIDTTSNGDFGYDETYGVFAAFVDTGDGAHVDPGGDASVAFTWLVVGDEIRGTFTVSGLDDGDVVVVEPWLVLEDSIPDGVTGNVQSRLISAHTGAPGFDANPGKPGIQTDVISTGNQTVPLLRVQEFFTADADLSVIKSDSDGASIGSGTLTTDPDPDPLTAYAGGTFTYTLLVTNHSTDTIANGVVVTDTLDADVTFVSASDGGTESAGVVTWGLGSLVVGETKLLTVTVLVSETPSDSDLLNTVTVEAITDDPDLSNNTDTEPTELGAPPIGIPTIIKDVTDVDGGGAFASVNEAGDVITYEVTVSNSGDADLTGATVTDTIASLTQTFGNDDDGILSPGEAWIYTGTYTAIQGDLDTNGGGDGDPAAT